MNDKQVRELIKFLISDEELSPAFRRKINIALDPDVYSVHYSVDDMEEMIDRRNEIEGETLYDHTNAREALKAMVENADNEYGITYYTFDHYIDEYCLVEDR